MVLGQPSDSIGSMYINVDKRHASPTEAPVYLNHYAHDRDFYRRRELRLIDFDQADNAPLNEAQADAPGASSPGLVAHLIHGLAKNHIQAIDPSREGRAYTYAHLVLDMAALQGLEPDSNGTIARHRFAWDNLARIMLMVRVRGFKANAGREYDHPELLMLIWLDPQRGQRYPLAVFDMAEIQPWLETLRCSWLTPQQRATWTDANRWLKASASRYPLVEFHENDLTPLPENRLSLDAWPDFFRH
jgi:hypothetical protein